MDSKHSVCIAFAGPFGCSKTPVAHYLSCELDWPIISSDTIRNEIKEDTLDPRPNREELEKRRSARIEGLIMRGQSFIADMSQDRRFSQFKEYFGRESIYNVGVISFDPSHEFYRKILKAKEYSLPGEEIARYMYDHENFVSEYGDKVICRITDDNFPDRLKVALEATRQFIDDKGLKSR